MYFVFLFCTIVMLSASYRIFDRDIMHPAVFLYLFSCAAITFGFYLFNYWKLYEFGSLTTQIFILGLGAFGIGSLVAKFNKSHYVIGKKHVQVREIARGRISINGKVVLFAIVLSVATFIIFLLYYRTRVTSSQLLSNFLEYKNSRDENELPGYINVSIKTLCAFSHCFAFLFIHNKICTGGKRKDLCLLVPAIVYCIISLMMANRGNILMFAFSCLAAWYILYQRHIGWKTRTNHIFIKKSFKIAIVVFILFWLFMVLTRNIVLSNASSAFDNFMTYICCYFSGGLPAFDMYLKQGGTSCQWWGQETFVALNNNMNTLFGTGNASTRFLEFRSGFGYSVVNIYTAFRRFYHDFGVFGVLILSFIQGHVTSRVYYLVKRNSEKASIDFLMVCYCFFFYTVPYTIVDEFFYSSNISISGLAKLVILLVTYCITFYGSRQDESPKKMDETVRKLPCEKTEPEND